MTLTVDNIEFSFPDTVIDAYKFDETDKTSAHYHGVSQLKAVDVLVETPEEYVFIEIKDHPHTAQFRSKPAPCPTCGHKQDHVKWLKDNLVRKYRDTFLYRYCEDKLDKPVRYICLLVKFDAMLLKKFNTILKESLPVNNVNKERWKKGFARNVTALNIDAWNRACAGRYGTVRRLL